MTTTSSATGRAGPESGPPGVYVTDRAPRVAAAPTLMSGVPVFIGFARPQDEILERRGVPAAVLTRWNADAFAGSVRPRMAASCRWRCAASSPMAASAAPCWRRPGLRHRRPARHAQGRRTARGPLRHRPRLPARCRLVPGSGPRRALCGTGRGARALRADGRPLRHSGHVAVGRARRCGPRCRHPGCSGAPAVRLRCAVPSLDRGRPH